MKIHDSKYRYLIPNSVTFVSLACGVIAILAAGLGQLTLSGVLILVSYVLDLLDGELARRLQAGSTFGLQLDSLADLVSLGAAPAILAFFHLHTHEHVPAALLWPAIVAYVLAGAYRLARFNLLPVKEGQRDSVGLTISTGGATLALAVLSDVANSNEVISDLYFIPLLVILSALMVSRIDFPSIVSVFSRRWANFLYMAYFAGALLLLQLPLFFVWFLFNSGYLGVTVARAGYRVLGD
jgi:CDP-diacylglycerol--serine O-phosphatidyltransferase